jgi:hypothetical protein
MERAIRLIAAFGLLGVGISCAGAWIIGATILYDSESPIEQYPFARPEGFWLLDRVSAFGSQRQTWWYVGPFEPSRIQAQRNAAIEKWNQVTPSGWPPSWGMLDRLPHEGVAKADRWLEDARGWPAVCMRCEFPRPFRGTLPVTGGIRLADAGADVVLDPRAIPYTPHWRGLFLNSAFYGALLWLIWLTSGTIRRRFRHRRGLCRRCGYDLRGGQTTCPECGSLPPDVLAA